jgi:hypothetical protein
LQALFRSHEGVPGTVDPAQPVRSLDRLYAQAHAAAGPLHAAAVGWAGRFGGKLDEGRPDEARSGAAAAREEETLLGWLGRGLVKPPGRAVGKAAFCYGGDASRLLDLCRARIVFADPAGLAACAASVLAEAARADALGPGPPAGVVVVRVKNGLRLRHDPDRTGGFRVRAPPPTAPRRQQPRSARPKPSTDERGPPAGHASDSRGSTDSLEIPCVH